MSVSWGGDGVQCSFKLHTDSRFIFGSAIKMIKNSVAVELKGIYDAHGISFGINGFVWASFYFIVNKIKERRMYKMARFCDSSDPYTTINVCVRARVCESVWRFESKESKWKMKNLQTGHMFDFCMPLLHRINPEQSPSRFFPCRKQRKSIKFHPIFMLAHMLEGCKTPNFG